MKKLLTIGVGLILVSLALVWMVIAPQQVERTPDTSKQPAAEYVAPKVEPPTVPELLRLVNEERAKVGVAPLVIDERLNQSAQIKAEDMTANDYMAHVDKNGKHGYEYARDAAPECVYVSENILKGMRTEWHTAYAAVLTWMASPLHKEAILDPKYTYTGFGVAGLSVVEHFCQI